MRARIAGIFASESPAPGSSCAVVAASVSEFGLPSSHPSSSPASDERAEEDEAAVADPETAVRRHVAPDLRLVTGVVVGDVAEDILEARHPSDHLERRRGAAGEAEELGIRPFRAIAQALAVFQKVRSSGGDALTGNDGIDLSDRSPPSSFRSRSAEAAEGTAGLEESAVAAAVSPSSAAGERALAVFFLSLAAFAVDAAAPAPDDFPSTLRAGPASTVMEEQPHRPPNTNDRARQHTRLRRNERLFIISKTSSDSSLSFLLRPS